MEVDAADFLLRCELHQHSEDVRPTVHPWPIHRGAWVIRNPQPCLLSNELRL